MSKFLHNRSRAKDEMLLEWCLPQGACIEGYNVVKDRIEITFILNGKTVSFDTAFPGWRWLEVELKSRRHVKESLMRNIFL